MNIINTILDKGPHWAGSVIVAAAGYTYARRRFNAQFWNTIEELSQRDVWTEEKINAWQERKILSLLIHAHRNSAFYRERFESAGLPEADIRVPGSGMEILKALPLLNREDVAAFAEMMLIKDLAKPIDWHKTSGTTGQPLRFALPRRLRWTINYSHLYRFYDWHGFYVKDSRATIGGRYLGRKPGGAVFRNPFENQLLFGIHGLGPDSIIFYVQALNSFRPKAIQGHPSAIGRLVSLAEDKGLTLPSLHVVFVTGETVRKEDSDKIEAAFRAPLVSLYGHGEMCVMAAQCKYRQGFHVDPFYGYVELVDHPSGYKEIVATSLHNDVMPFLRYRTGDLTEGWLDSPCSCGRSFRRLNQILGRIDDMITDTAGQPVIAVQIRTDLGQAFGNLPPYSIVQHGTTRLYSIRLYSDNPDVVDLGTRMTIRLRHWLGEDSDISVQVRPASDVHFNSGKHKTVYRESLLPLNGTR